jgi:uncharacterized protein (TIGR03382 family)
MMNRKLLLAIVGVAGLGLATDKQADAAPTVSVIAPPDGTGTDTTGVLRDQARVNNGRLRRDDEKQPGAEQPAMVVFNDNKTGIVFVTKSGSVNGLTPTNRVQLALIPFHLEQDVEGNVQAVADITAAKFVTDNDGNEYRQANHPTAFLINNGDAACTIYNFQPRNTNNTEQYIQCFNRQAATILPQTRAFAYNNDDCCAEASHGAEVISFDAGKNRLMKASSHNGNGDDAASIDVFNVNCDAPTNATSCTFKREYDVRIIEQEERTRAHCTLGADKSFALCTGTAGNNQPARDNTWAIGVDLTAGKYSGTNQQAALLFKTQIDGRKNIDIGGGQTVRTYSSRVNHERVLGADANGVLIPTDQILIETVDSRGNNANEGRIGGHIYQHNFGLYSVTRTGITPVIPMTDLTSDTLGFSSVHTQVQVAVFGTKGNLMPGLQLSGGSHTGGGAAGQLMSVGLDATNKKFTVLGTTSIAPWDRHLYPNYEGNNPGNQGRNFANAVLIKNPFVGVLNNNDAYLQLVVTTGKTMNTMMHQEIKLSTFISVVGVAQDHDATSGGGSDQGSGGSNSGSGNTDPNQDSGTTLGGCSATNAGTGAAMFLLIGLVSFLRRRR